MTPEEKVIYMKAWRVANRDKIYNKHKAWRDSNPEWVEKKRAERHVCGCGKTYSTLNKINHFKTKVHTKYENSAPK